MTLDSTAIEQLIKFRKELHQYPELSGKEKETADKIGRFLRNLKPDELITDIGGHGLLAVFDSGKKGPTVAFRADIDALSIQEENTFDYVSKNPGVSHTCGHDGHTTMVCGLGMVLAAKRPDKGKAVLLFQPSEETGEGALAMLQDAKVAALNIDYIFGLHNLPNFEKEIIVLKPKIFAVASTGMVIKLKGATSHAGEPQHGRSPAKALAAIITGLGKLPRTASPEALALVTVVHALLGEIAFGVSPGYAEIRATLRAKTDKNLRTLCQKAELLVAKSCENPHLEFEFEYVESFPATENDEKAYKIMEEVARKHEFKILFPDRPFSWSEDFGQFKKIAKTGFIGLGAGKEQPDLHNYNYDFNDEIIPAGVKYFEAIAARLLHD